MAPRTSSTTKLSPSFPHRTTFSSVGFSSILCGASANKVLQDGARVGGRTCTACAPARRLAQIKERGRFAGWTHKVAAARALRLGLHGGWMSMSDSTWLARDANGLLSLSPVPDSPLAGRRWRWSVGCRKRGDGGWCVGGWTGVGQPPCSDRLSGRRRVTSDADCGRPRCSHMGLQSCGGGGC